MKLPRDLSGPALAKCLCQHWNYVQVHQTGSHIILDTKDPFPQRVAIPAHKNLRVGTLHGILKSIAHHYPVNNSKNIFSIATTQ